jgi:phosphoglycolate phosphatase-like HAD superfamily hydrolase
VNGHLAIFDIDGTLCDTYDVDDECFCATVAEVLGARIDANEWAQAPHVTDSSVIPWVWERHRGRRPSAAELGRFADVYERRLAEVLARALNRFRPVPGAHDLLALLPQRGWEAAVATGGWARLARLKLRAAGFATSLLRACADDSPDRADIFREAGRRAAAAAHSDHVRTVLVGDGVWDARVAKQLDWPMLGVGHGERALRLAQHGVRSIVRDFSDSETVLQHLEQCTVPQGAGS